jgi:hypothetical protein
MKAGDKIWIDLGNHPKDVVQGTVTAVLPAGVVKATIDDQGHPLATHQEKPRELTITPGNYETV